MEQVLDPARIEEESRLGDDVRRWSGLLWGIGVVTLAVAAGLGFAADDHFARFFRAYLTTYAFLLSLCLGAVFFVTVHHLVGAKWFVTVRRITELLMAGFPLMAVLFLPILLPLWFGSHSLFEWADPELVASDHLLHGKAPYLNVPFFTVRAVVYFAVWIGIARFFVGRSVAQDASGDPRLTLEMRRFAAPALVLFALTTTFAAFDWLMSLEPHWFSTIFGVYYFAGSVLAFFGAVTLTLMLLQENGRLTSVVHVEHYHDLGKYLFAFTFFWGYIAFSQYMLIWYGDLPEETFWFDIRQTGNWVFVSKMLVVFHFIVPFAGLLSRHVKRNKAPLAFFAILLLAMHWIDVFWIVMPSLRTPEIGFGLVDLTCLLGLGAIFVGAFIRRLGAHVLTPVRDPYFEDSVRFHQVF